MKSDELTYLRAVRVGFMGFAIQLVLALVLLIYSLFAIKGAIDYASFTIFLLALSGLLPWLGLIIVYHQQKLAAIEALEAERFAATAATSVFEDEDLRVAQKRLNTMYKFLFPTISLLMAAYLIGVGFWRWQGGRILLDIDNYHPTQQSGWGIALGAILGLAGYIFASFVAGMSNQKAWKNLRGGAGAIAGTALAAFALAVALGIDRLGNNDFGAARYMQVIIPVYMIILGVEIILNFLLNIYRPRTRGEVPRPAFDSQILALVAQPQSVAKSVGSALSYQFGFEVGETWFYQLLAKAITSLALLAVLIFWGLTCLVIVEPDEQAIITRFGRIVRNEHVVQSGLHLKAPWPIERVERFQSMRIHQIQLSAQPDTESKEPILWTNAHSLNPNDYIIVSPGTMGNIESTGLTHLPVENDLELLQDAEGDKTSRDRAPGRTIALINAEVPLQFRIRDVLKYVRLAPQNDREDLLRFVAQRELMRYMAPLEIDQILGPDRLKIGKELEKRIQQAFDNMGVKDASGRPAGAGVEVVFVGLSNVHPPKDVAESFQQVVQAEQESVRLIEEGRKEAISRLAAVAGSLEHSRHIVEQIDILNRLEEDPENNREEIIQQRQRIEKLLRAAGGTAAVKVNQAQSERWQVQMKEWAAALTFQARIATYQAAPNLYIWRKILEVYETKLAHTRLFVNATDGKAHIRIDLKSEVAPPAIEQVDTGE